MLVNREAILAKIEGTYNIDPTPTALADAVLVENISESMEGARMHERPAVRASNAPLKQVFGGTLRGLSFDVEIKGSGTIDTAPECGVLLRACGFGETITASTSVAYAPVSTGIESCTIYYYQDGRLTTLTGCRGNVSFALGADGVGKLSFNFTGHTATPTDASIVTGTYDSTVPVPFINASFLIDSFAGVISALNFDMSNTIATPPSVNATDGYADIKITGRDLNGSIDPEDELVATESWEANWRNGTSMALATGTIGSAVGNRYAITMPAVYYREQSPGDRDGIRTKEMAFAAAESSTDDELNILFT